MGEDCVSMSDMISEWRSEGAVGEEILGDRGVGKGELKEKGRGWREK